MTTPDKELDEILDSFKHTYNIPLNILKGQTVQAIKEWSCKQRGCEPYEGLTEQMQPVTGCCKYCGNRDKIRRQP